MAVLFLPVRRKIMAKRPEWLDNAVFYEIYPQSFNDTDGDGIGNIKGITEKLDYIRELGCTAVWLNPCFDSPFGDAASFRASFGARII